MILVNELALNMKLALEFHYRKKKTIYSNSDMEHKKKMQKRQKKIIEKLGENLEIKGLYQSPLPGRIVGGKYGLPLAQFSPISNLS